MKQGSIFTKTRKEAPADEVSKSTQLLIQAGFINKEIAGVYDMLPFGLRVLRKVENIIRTEMDSVGGQELEMSALQDPEVWKQTDRWDEEKVDAWFKTSLANGTELGLGFTHEEPLTRLMIDHINSYKDLPIYVYQFQNKFRNELRAKSGIMRGREFLMKDLYSFSISEEQHNEFYEKMKTVYKNIFEAVGLGEITYLTFASGGSFTKYSHEFQTISPIGEDKIFLDEEKNIAVNEEVMNEEVLGDLSIEKSKLKECKTVEVGNIFSLGTKFSEGIGLYVNNEKGERVPVVMGSYGIGVGRLIGVVAETFADEKGLVWPDDIAPFKFHLVNLLKDSDDADKIYDEMIKNGAEVLYDDRNVSPGQKLADSDLIGIPNRIIVGKTFTETNKIELVNRKTGETETIEISDLIKKL